MPLPWEIFSLKYNLVSFLLYFGKIIIIFKSFNQNPLIMKKTDYQASFEEANITNESAQLLMTTSRWAKFISIFGFIVYGLVIIGSIIGASVMSKTGAHMAAGYATMKGVYGPGVFSWGFAVPLIIISLIYFIPLYFQLRFAVKIQKAFRIGDTPTLTEAFRSLRNYYVIMGIFLIVTILFAAVGMIIGMAYTWHV